MININYNGDNTVSIFFNYDAKILGYLKRFVKNAQFNPTNKSWNLSQVEGNETAIELFLQAVKDWNRLEISDYRKATTAEQADVSDDAILSKVTDNENIRAILRSAGCVNPYEFNEKNPNADFILFYDLYTGELIKQNKNQSRGEAK